MNAPHPAITPGRLAVVTGGGNGIGLAAARAFAGFGMELAIIDRDPAALDSARAEFGAQAVHDVDVADRAAMSALAESLMARSGPAAVVMNNAAIGNGGDALSNFDAWDRLLDINLMGVVHGVQAFVPAIAEGDAPGLVVNTGSKQGITQPPGNTAYNVSKSAVKSLTEGLAHTLREKTGTRVTAHLLVPGFTFTGMTRRHVAEKPASAWTPEQVVETMLDGIGRQAFYLWCLDNETTWETDRRRVLWNAHDITEGRPALSRWHPDWKDAFAAWMAEG
ncbi:SDR family NAD(P)-dependent oxidoreductase [Novosphingobium sp. KCTC 2891]|uniref:SDR family NAD(P)-dependent oxidoreductase n=1 Tax=Novosphingobium sp. KCTC 2891 TaxID=2989730 RepID=UPI002223E3C5|nr:SDR family NAD(P)-dependent oxidoreductase [Novosphingobium sp. KCTC 2891]MCW1382449.1 SDR family NAD(P)-dependent oxidoreductase [Novosphingobium sp. KCTC 2891]